MPLLVLASASPRRELLLRNAGVADMKIVPSNADETAEPGLSPDALVRELSRRKAAEVARRVTPDDVVLAADTVVALGGVIFGKPRDISDAERMISAMSGRTHEVFTGVTIMRGERAETFCESTRVTFRKLSQDEIIAYARSGEGLDKAGAYGIQGYGSLLVERVEGDYFTVIGLPVCRVGTELKKFGINLL